MQGRNSVTVRQTDVAGNVSAPTTLVFTLDTAAASVISMTLPAAGTYSPGSTLRFSVKFSEVVRIGGTAMPTIGITIGTTPKNAVYVSGAGTDTIVFAYTVTSGDRDTDGIAFTSSISLPVGTTFQDIAGNDVNRTLKLPSPLPKIVI